MKVMKYPRSEDPELKKVKAHLLGLKPREFCGTVKVALRPDGTVVVCEYPAKPKSTPRKATVSCT